MKTLLFYSTVLRRRDLLNNLTIKNCDKVEKFQKLKKKFKTILVKSLKRKRRFDVRLTSLSSQKMSKMKTNIVNLKEFLGDTNKTWKYVVIMTKYSHYFPQP